jgi:hypothetical protein
MTHRSNSKKSNQQKGESKRKIPKDRLHTHALAVLDHNAEINYIAVEVKEYNRKR